MSQSSGVELGGNFWYCSFGVLSLGKLKYFLFFCVETCVNPGKIFVALFMCNMKPNSVIFARSGCMLIVNLPRVAIYAL